MYTCPNCSELLGDNVRECPFCKHVVSDAEYRMAGSIKESMLEQAVQATMDEYGRRLRNGFIATLIYIVVIVAGIILMATLGMEQEIFFLLFIIALVVYMIITWKLRIGFCPYCEDMMGRGTLLRNHCPRCGGRLR